MLVKDKVLESLRNVVDLGSAIDIGLGDKLSALNVDTIDWMSIVMELEETYGIDIEEEKLDEIIENKTVQDFIDYIKNLTGNN